MFLFHTHTAYQKTFFQFLSLTIILLPYTLFTTGFNVFKLSLPNLLWLLLLGIVHTGIAYCMYFTSIKDMSGQKISILSFIDPVTSLPSESYIFAFKGLSIEIEKL